MLRMIWTCIVLCLIGAVILLGSAIFTGSSRVEQELALQKNQMTTKILKIKKEAMKKGTDFGKALKKIASAATDPGNGAAEQNADRGSNVGRSASETASVKKHGTNARAALGPVDEEDRELTETVMNHGRTKGQGISDNAQEPVKTVQEGADEGTSRKENTEEKSPPPPDLKRLNRIKELYVKTMKILDFN